MEVEYSQLAETQPFLSRENKVNVNPKKMLLTITIAAICIVGVIQYSKPSVEIQTNQPLETMSMNDHYNHLMANCRDDVRNNDGGNACLKEQNRDAWTSAWTTWTCYKASFKYCSSNKWRKDM